jgi:molybdopterin/thiamine biosynthesis adenylyltransferase
MYLAGAGAIGNGFLYALRHFDVRGTLYVADPKKVTSGGLNRCLFFSPEDVDHPKASRICEIIKPHFPKLVLVPVNGTLGEARKSRGKDSLIQRLVVSVDSRRARRSLQAELPGEVFDASTTNISEVVLHFNRQPTDLACLCCIYPENERERKHEENIADAFGVSLEDVRSGYITEIVARRICNKYPECKPEDLTGRAFDTVYKELCGVGALRNSQGQQVLAPFSFVSVLAGAYLAIEFAIRLRYKNALNRFNYWRASPWHNPNLLLRQTRSRDLKCEFCSKPSLRRILQETWGVKRS